MLAATRQMVRSHLLLGSEPPAGLIHPVKWSAFESEEGWAAYKAKAAVSHADTFGNCSATPPMTRAERPAGRLRQQLAAAGTNAIGEEAAGVQNLQSLHRKLLAELGGRKVDTPYGS